MSIIDRKIIKIDDGLNITYFMEGSKPSAPIIIDEENNAVYEHFGTDEFNQKMYWKLPLDKF